jgi:2-polyprenyl-3-methyl-5-hydroxy-6-metoxy-1,4-benzoquinol methylase
MEIKDFWEEAHQKNEELWLTGSYLNQVWDPLNITSKLAPGLEVLNIGVGLGRDTAELKDKGVIVDALDISQTALDRVKTITRNQYLASHIRSLPSQAYDVAVSHLVTQHMNESDLIQQVAHVLRSLKPDGIFAMQFAFIDETTEAYIQLERAYNNIMSQPPEQRGHMFRTLNKMKVIVEDVCGGKISWVSAVKEYSFTPIKWYYINIKRGLIK